MSNPQIEVDQTCGSIGITLSNKDIDAGPGDRKGAASFLITVDDRRAQQIEVGVDGVERWSKEFPEDSGDHVVVVKVEKRWTKWFKVTTDCVTQIPAKPRASIDARCLADGGAKGEVTLSNRAAPTKGQTASPVTFFVSIEGQDDKTVTVEAGATKTVPFAFPEGAGDRTVTVSVDGHRIAKEHVRVDCVKPPKPPKSPKPHAQITGECLKDGGAAGVVTLTVGSRGTGSVTFTVTIEGQSPKTVTVEAGATKTVPFAFPEGEGYRTVTVSVDGHSIAKEHVRVDCVKPPKAPKAYAKVIAECVPTGGAKGQILLVVGSRGSSPVTFTLSTQDQPVTLSPGERRTIEFTFPEGEGSRTVTVRVGDRTLAERSVQVDCATPPTQSPSPSPSPSPSTSPSPSPSPTPTSPSPTPTETTPAHPANPRVTPVVVCGEAQVTFTNPPAREGETPPSVTLHVVIDNAAPVDVVVGPNATVTRTYTFPEDSGSHTIAIDDDRPGQLIPTITVVTDCTQIDKTALPAEGTPVQAPQEVTYSVKVSNTSTVQSASGDVVDTLPARVVVVGPISDGGILSADGRTVTWPNVSLAGGESRTFTFTVRVTAGFGTPQLLNTSTWLGNSDQTVHPVKAIDANVVAYCRTDTPYYRVTVESQNLGPVDEQGRPHTVTVAWFQADDNGRPILRNGQGVPAFNPATGQPYVDTYPLVNGRLDTGELLWKGAKVDADGNPIDWPGWDLNSDGIWVEVPDGGVRPASILKVTVNPTSFDTAVYPPATPTCNANPTNSPPGETPVTPVNNPGPGGSTPDELAKTGGSVTPLLLLALTSLAAGLALKRASRYGTR